MRPLLSARYLARQIGVPLDELRALARDVRSHYREWKATDEKTGKIRTFKVPDSKLKVVQRRILRNFLNEYVLPDAAHGGIKGRSPKTNATQHCGNSLVVTMDIRDFYPSVSHKQVAKMFRCEFGGGRETTWLLTRLTTIDGQLPQGAPTSTAVANILLAGVADHPAQTSADQRDVDITRFIDDYAFSGESAESMINDVARFVSRVGLRMWRKRKKLKIMPASRRQEVTGLNVNSPHGPSVPREKRDRVRTAIFQLRNLTVAESEKEIRSILGRINHVEQHNKGAALRLRRQFEAIASRATLRLGALRHCIVDPLLGRTEGRRSRSRATA